MGKKDFWKGFGTAAALTAAVCIAWKPVCRGIPWESLPFGVEMPRSAKISMVEDYLERYYVEDVEKEKIDDMLYTGMMAGVGDQYTYYMTADSLNRYMDDSNGRFGGIGIEVSLTRDGETVIGRVNEGGPAERAGILSGDIIIGVDGEDMRGRTREDIVIRTRGDIGKPVKVKVYRESDNSTPEFEMVREEIVVRSVESRMLEDGMGYILITGFKENTCEQFMTAMETLQEQGMRALVLDLRYNPGGSVNTVYQIGDELLPEGTMVYTVDNQEKRRDYLCDAEYADLPMVVLVNGNSASASEILAGAIKDRGVGTLIGTQTFGKGLVQRLFFLPDGSGLHITIQKYYTPNGTSIHGVGITPDEVVELPEEYAEVWQVDSIPEEEDTQLKRAKEVLRQETR